MADPPRHPETGDDSRQWPEPESTTRGPRWPTVLLWIIGIVLVLGFLVLHLTGTLGPGAH